MKNHTAFQNNKKAISYEQIYSRPIIGYCREFWAHCNEQDKQHVSALRRDEKQRKIKMYCDKHKNIEFSISPYYYFVTEKRCPYCKSKEDIGAVKADESIAAFWNDSRFILDEISEHSSEQFQFHCPFCGHDFSESMESMINKSPKCPKCSDGVSYNKPFDGEEDVPYLLFSRLHRY